VLDRNFSRAMFDAARSNIAAIDQLLRLVRC
jgi:hypothetical protein